MASSSFPTNFKIKLRTPAIIGRFGAFLIMVLLIAFTACKSDTNISKSEREKFVTTYVELAIIRANNNQSGGTYDDMIADTFTRNKTSKEFMRLVWKKILTRPQIQEDIYRDIMDRLKTIETLPADSLDKLTKSVMSTI
jgi:hypothetical protein